MNILTLAERHPEMQLGHMTGPRQTTCNNLAQLHAIHARANASMCFDVCARLATMLPTNPQGAMFAQLLLYGLAANVLFFLSCCMGFGENAKNWRSLKTL